jgi:hypothetical protein
VAPRALAIVALAAILSAPAAAQEEDVETYRPGD